MEEQKKQNKENQLNWLTIPNHYKLMKDEIEDKVLLDIYSKFSFKYYKFNENQNSKNDDEKFFLFVFNYLIKYKFIIYHLTNDPNLNIPSRTNCVICIEDECLIIEEIEKSLLIEILSKLQKEQISLINVGKNRDHNFNQIEKEAKEEIRAFSEHFQETIRPNFFISYTINSIIGYLIRRHYFQSSYFNDPKFFYFDENSLFEHETKNKISDLIYGEHIEKETVEEIQNDLNKIRKFENNFQKYKFNEDEFIKLRTLYTKTDFSIYLMIHIKTLHLFCMKKFIYPILNDADNHEINFSNFSHRCFVRCYGLFRTKDETVCIIYKFMSNGDLNTYIRNNEVKDIFKFTTIIRIIAGIEYLQKNKQIHRDLKPSNILIDHDYLPYISDFETIKSISTETQNTVDIGSILYSSPEQDRGLDLSYPTDIYSFGLILYFLFEKEDMFELFSDKKSIKQMTSGPSIIRYIYSKCVEYNSERRMTLNEIKTIFNDILFFYEQNFVSAKDKSIRTQVVI